MGRAREIVVGGVGTTVIEQQYIFLKKEKYFLTTLLSTVLTDSNTLSHLTRELNLSYSDLNF